MLYFVVVLSLLSAAYADSDGKPMMHLPPVVITVVMEAAANCIKETGVKPEVSENFFNLKLGSDPGSKKFLYCLGRKVNYADEDGHLNDIVLTLFEGNDRKDEIQKVIEKCNKIKKNDRIETLFHIFTCVHKNSPVLIGI